MFYSLSLVILCSSRTSIARRYLWGNKDVNINPSVNRNACTWCTGIKVSKFNSVKSLSNKISLLGFSVICCKTKKDFETILDFHFFVFTEQFSTFSNSCCTTFTEECFPAVCDVDSVVLSKHIQLVSRKKWNSAKSSLYQINTVAGVYPKNSCNEVIVI